MRGKIGNKARLQHIFAAISELEDFVQGVTLEDFSSNRMMQLACVRNLEIIGEASSHLTEEFKAQHTNTNWTALKGLRNVIVHEYFRVDIQLVWQLLKTELPNLKQVVLQALNNFEE